MIPWQKELRQSLVYKQQARNRAWCEEGVMCLHNILAENKVDYALVGRIRCPNAEEIEKRQTIYSEATNSVLN